MTEFALNPALDADSLRARLDETGRIHIPEILTPESAEAVGAALAAEREWTRSVTARGSAFYVPLKDDEPQSDTHRKWLADAAVDPDEHAMQFVYDARAISQDKQLGRVRGDVLDAFEDWLNRDAWLNFQRRLTGDDRIARSTAQGSRFLPGHVLTAHSDRDLKRERLFAYVLNFSRPWCADWGGLLLFYDEAGHVSRGFTPSFNSLNLFKVPAAHAVSQVASYAPAPRLAVSGWLQSSPEA